MPFPDCGLPHELGFVSSTDGYHNWRSLRRQRDSLSGGQTGHLSFQLGDHVRKISPKQSVPHCETHDPAIETLAYADLLAGFPAWHLSHSDC
jgi:hypothetical protein